MTPFNLPIQPQSPEQLAAAKRQVYETMLQGYGLTMQDAQHLIDEHEVQLFRAVEKFRRAHTQAAMALAAKLEQLANSKR